MSFSTSFSRLPIKTLKSCIWVCKSWYQAIHSLPFATIHFKKASQRPTHLTSLLLRDRDKRYDHGLLELEHNCFRNSSNTFHDVDDSDGLTALNTTTLDQLNSEYECVGSCHGLLCLVVSKNNNSASDAIKDSLYICNPVLGEYMALPSPTQSTMHRIGYGFGFESATNEYKIIRLAFHWIDFAYIRKPSFQLVGEVYTIGAGMWRSIGNVPYPLNTIRSEAFVNGALHWMSDSYVSEVSPGVIVSFDLGTEEFKVVPHPPGYCQGKPENYLLDLGEIRRATLFVR